MCAHRCSCLESFEGPRCQQTYVIFNGKGWAWYPPLDQCHQSHTMSTKVKPSHQGHTSLELITTRESGLILYFGPLTDRRDVIKEDFVLLELHGGYPVLRVNQGSGEASLRVDGRDRQGHLRLGKLSDGRWHRLDIFINGQVLVSTFYSSLRNDIRYDVTNTQEINTRRPV